MAKKHVLVTPVLEKFTTILNFYVNKFKKLKNYNSGFFDFFILNKILLISRVKLFYF